MIYSFSKLVSNNEVYNLKIPFINNEYSVIAIWNNDDGTTPPAIYIGDKKTNSFKVRVVGGGSLATCGFIIIGKYK